MEINSRKQLEEAIARLEEKKDGQKQMLKTTMNDTLVSARPANLFKNYVFNSDNAPSLLKSKGLWASIGSLALGIASKKLLPAKAASLLSVLPLASKPTPAKPQMSDTTRNSLMAAVLTAGAGMLIKNLTKNTSKSKTSVALNNVLGTVLTTVVLGNIDKVVSYIDATIKTDFGKKTPEEIKVAELKD